jgi:hypothetical protein
MTAEIFTFEDYRRLGQPSRVDELESEWPLFIDWLTIRQAYPEGGLRRVFDGVTIRTDRDGQIEYELFNRDEIEGSFDSRMWLRCDGNSVEFHGNIARYSRRDNVFGYSWSETIRRVNELLNLHSLPPFVAGRRERYADSGVVWIDGARVSRIDITVNYAAGSVSDAQRVLHALSQHHVGRQRGTVSPDEATVMYGYGSKYISGKVYLKHIELERHRRKKSGAHVDPEVIEFCRSIGMLREEFTLKSRFLTQTGFCWLGEVTADHLQAIYRARSQFRRFREMEIKDTSALSAGARGTLARYEQGEPHGLKRATYYRHRAEILKTCGIDISVPRNVEKVQAPVKIVSVQPLVAPEWYRRKYG